MSEDGLKELLDFSVSAAREAGEITLRYFRREVETRLKGKDNFVTQADLEAEEFLRREILKRFPGDAIVGEEAAETIIAAKDEDAGALAAETADLVYHLVVLLVERGLTLEALGGELARRRGGGRSNE